MSKQILKSVLDQATEKGSLLVVVFDLDSTLFCTDHRTERIIHDSIETQDFKKLFPNEIEKIKKFKINGRDWSIEDIFEREGFSGDHPAVSFIYKSWRNHFFNNKYLDFDKPYNGASEFVNGIKQKGAEILYLTARSQSRMKEGTIKSLKQWGFPLAKEEHLILKTDEDMADSAYKCNELTAIHKRFKTVLFFENEPVILNAVQKQLPEIQLFWVDSTHSKKEHPPKEAQVIFPDYKLY